jgi:outer membrane receptor protein involved in Fe transport
MTMRLFSVSGNISKSLILSLAIAMPGAAFAQVDEIVVTARKKAESVQDIPLSITSFDAEAIKRKGINNIGDIAKNTAGLVFDQGITAQDTRVVIRGLSPTRGRQNIAFLQDNVDISSEAISTAGGSLLVNPRYLDFERIEIVKGPQSALYGRAAFNGAVNYITKDPGDTFEADISADTSTAAGSGNDEHSVTVSAGGPVTDTLALRGSATWWDDDGYYNNPFTEFDNLGGGDGFGLSLKGKWEPQDNLTVRGRIGYSDDQYEQRPAAFLEYNKLTFFPEEALTYQYIQRDFAGGDPNDFKNYSYNYCGPLYEPGGAPTLTLNAATQSTQCAQDTIANVNGNLSQVQKARVKGPLFTSPVASFKGQLPSADELNIGLSPDPRTIDPNGINMPKDYPGTHIEVIRATFDVDWDVAGGNIGMWGGYTDSTQNVLIDFDKFASRSDGVHAAVFQSPTGPGPDRILGTSDDIECSLSGGDCAWGTQQIDFTTKTQQESFELRYASENEGMFNYTVGGLFWHELTEQVEHSTTARASGSTFPFPDFPNYPNSDGGVRPNCYSAAAGPAAGVALQNFMPDWQDLLEPGDQFFVEGVPGYRTSDGVSVPVGFNLLCPPSSSDVLQYLDQRAIIQPRLKSAETNHWSVYSMLDFELTETVTLSFEGRYTNEIEEQVQPILDPSDPEFSVRQSPSSIQPNCGTDPTSPLPGGAICGPSIPENAPVNGPWVTPSTISTRVSTRTSFFTPRIALQWQPIDDQMYYVSYAVGKKPGGFSRLTGGSGGFNADESIFTEETLKVYEIGSKTTFFNGRVQINAAAYLQDFTDKQVPTTLINFATGLSTAAVENAGKAEIKGLELEVNWAATDRLDLGLAYNYLEGVYKDFEIWSSSSNDLTRNSNDTYISNDANVGTGAYNIGTSCTNIRGRSVIDSFGNPALNLQCQIDLTGNSLEDLPKNSLNLNGLYTAPFFDTGIDWYAEGEYIYQDERFLEQSNDNWIEAYTIVDARLGLVTDQWEAIFFVDNVFDDETIQSAQTGPGISTGNFITGPPRVRNQVIAYPTTPRVYGLRFSYNFGS